LVIACANVACLLLAALGGRRGEMATRRSLGAGGGALARQLLIEGVAYAIGGGLLGTAAVVGGIGFLRDRGGGIPRITEVRPDVRTLAVIVGVTGLATILFSAAPVIEVFRNGLSGSLRRSGRCMAGARQRLPRILVSTQIALATALMIGAGLFVRTLMKLD